ATKRSRNCSTSSWVIEPVAAGVVVRVIFFSGNCEGVRAVWSVTTTRHGRHTRWSHPAQGDESGPGEFVEGPSRSLPAGSGQVHPAERHDGGSVVVGAVDHDAAEVE